MQNKKQQLEPQKEQLTRSKLGKEYIRAVYCHAVYLTSMQSTSDKMPGWMNHKLESRLQAEIVQLQICRCTTLTAETEKELTTFFLYEGERVKKLA